MLDIDCSAPGIQFFAGIRNLDQEYLKMKRTRNSNKAECAKSAWLVTWDGTSDIPEDPVVAILNYRMSASSVQKFVGLLYATLQYEPRTKLLCAKNPKAAPYPATMRRFQKIDCGHNPWLYARLVTDLKVTDGKLTWTEALSDTERHKRLKDANSRR
jgi:hypothetical protein